jgi:FlaA1/EpsC-like NDP-sugar epimerase
MATTRSVPRWTILLIDLGLCGVALVAAYQLRFNFQVPRTEVDLLLPVLPWFFGVRLVSFVLAGTHRGMVRYTSTDDAKRLFLTVLGGTLAFAALNLVRFKLLTGIYFLPFSVIVIDFMATAILLIATRIVVKLLYLRAKGSGKDTIRVVIHGAGEAGIITKRTLEREGSARYKVEAFVDDDPRKTGNRMEGVLISPSADLPRMLADGNVDQVIIAILNPDPEHRRQVVDACMAAHVRVLSIPPVNDWINGQLSSGQIREVRIEDLLGRPVIRLDDALVKEQFAGRRVLVTGAAGSIGSEIVRQLIGSGASRVVMLDMAESALYDLEMELQNRGLTGFGPVIGDVRDETAMEALFSREKPEVVFHAAAYKHVPLMEAQPHQAIRNNLGGTRSVATMAVKHGVEQFIFISTDKAVNPTSVMGASKRAAEILVQELASRPEASGTRFVITRFGNVLGSNGSVIPLFRRQIAEGGPVTVTHPEVTRFFMTIPEACRLVLEAATMGKGGEIYVFDMGQPVRIADLADRMIRLSGKEPGRDIEVKFTGLRPGEKLFEELLSGQEDTQATHHPRILIGKERALVAGAQELLDELVRCSALSDDGNCVIGLKQLIPEYRSLNSVYTTFDAPAASSSAASGSEA